MMHTHSFFATFPFSHKSHQEGPSQVRTKKTVADCRKLIGGQKMKRIECNNIITSFDEENFTLFIYVCPLRKESVRDF